MVRGRYPPSSRTTQGPLHPIVRQGLVPLRMAGWKSLAFGNAPGGGLLTGTRVTYVHVLTYFESGASSPLPSASDRPNLCGNPGTGIVKIDAGGIDLPVGPFLVPEEPGRPPAKPD